MTDDPEVKHEYEVGYSKPPKHTQFQTPRGYREPATLLYAIYSTTARKAANGDLKAAR